MRKGEIANHSQTRKVGSHSDFASGVRIEREGPAKRLGSPVAASSRRTVVRHKLAHRWAAQERGGALYRDAENRGNVPQARAFRSHPRRPLLALTDRG